MTTMTTIDTTQQLVGMGDSLKTLAHEYLALKAGRPNDTTVSAQVLLAAAEENFNDSFWQTHDKASRLLEAIRLSPEGSKRSTLFQELDTLSRSLEDKVQALKDTRDDAASDTASLAALGFGIGGAILLAGLGASVGVVLAGGAVITGVGHVVGQWVAGREEADLAEAALIAGTTAVGGAVTARVEAIALGQGMDLVGRLGLSTSAGMAGGGIGGIGLGVARMTEEDSGAVKAEKLIRGMGDGMAMGAMVGFGLRTVHSAATYLKTTVIPKLNGLDPLPKLWARLTPSKPKAAMGQAETDYPVWKNPPQEGEVIWDEDGIGGSVRAAAATVESPETLTGIRFLRHEYAKNGVLLQPNGTEMPLPERARRVFGVGQGVPHKAILNAKERLRQEMHNTRDRGGEGPWMDGKIDEYEQILLAEANSQLARAQAVRRAMGPSSAASPASRPAPVGAERVLDPRILELDSRGRAAWELLDLPSTPQTQSEIKEAIRRKLASINWTNTAPDHEIAEIDARQVVRINDAGVYLLQLLKTVVI